VGKSKVQYLKSTTELESADNANYAPVHPWLYICEVEEVPESIIQSSIDAADACFRSPMSAF